MEVIKTKGGERREGKGKGRKLMGSMSGENGRVLGRSQTCGQR